AVCRRRSRSVVTAFVPLDDVRQPPGILVQLELQLSLLVDDELSGREKHAFTLALVFIIHGECTGGEIEALRLRIPVGFAESNLAAGNKTDGSAGRR